jgi:clan AA aspartic protease (TIGR02281 family)
MPKYVIEVRRESSGWGWLVFAFLVGCGIAAVAHNHPAKPPPQQLENPFDMAPAGDDEPPDTATPDKPAPPLPTVKQAAAGRIVASMEGKRCRVDAFANGEKFDFLIDTGASDIWFDGPAMARRLGFNPAKLKYDETFTGGGRAASVRLREFRIGGFAVNDVAAYIDKGGTVYGGRGPLFGMSILKGVRLEVANGGCVLVLPQLASSSPAYKPGDRADMERLISNAR